MEENGRREKVDLVWANVFIALTGVIVISFLA